MTRLIKLCLSAAVVATCFAMCGEANAQNYGYRFGVGLNYANNRPLLRNRGLRRNFVGGAIIAHPGIAPRAVEPPFFAMYPPVYYDKMIVRRPYGVSPYAAPPGIVPVEMNVVVPPQVQKNPYFVPETPPVSEEEPLPNRSEEIEDGKST